MHKELQEKGYLYVPQFVRPERAVRLTAAFRECAARGNLKGDNQVPNSSTIYNFIPFLELLVDKTPKVNELVGETVLPTYTYARIYNQGAQLGRHRDREACEISLTLHLAGSHEWPIWFEMPGKEPVSRVLNPGDAVLYLGTKAYHWREPFEGDDYVQVFLHYVRSRGPCSFAYFDKVRKPKS